MQRTTRAFVWCGLAALLGAAMLHLLTTLQQWHSWPAMVHLTLFGWISMLIWAINYHTLPVFSGRDFPDMRLIWLHLLASTAGLVLSSAGLVGGWRVPVIAGLVLQIAGAMLFIANAILLFMRGPRHDRRPPRPLDPQQRIDRYASWATRLSGLCLPPALLLLLGCEAGWLSGRWMLAAEHLAALGWVMLMIVGVAYHVLPRWTARPLRGTAWVRFQLASHGSGLTLMVLALGFSWATLFALGGLLMALAVLSFIWTVWPVLQAARPPFRATIEFHEEVRS